jgi:HAD superfamily hydrolase (TIGR01509 family)
MRGSNVKTPFSAVIFDLDGTLADTGLDFEAIRRELDFPDSAGLLEHLATLADPEQVSHAHAVIDRHEMAGAARATWIDGARDVVEYLHRSGCPTGVLTRNSRQAVARTCAVLGLDMDPILTRDDCRPKPDPDGLLTIARALAVDPAGCVYVGDFIHDLDCARQAGMTACLFRNASNEAFETHADLVLNSFADLYPYVRSGG